VGRKGRLWGLVRDLRELAYETGWSGLQVHLAQQGVVARVGAEGKAGKQAQIRGFNSSISPNYLNREPVDSEQYINC